jgi:hypothetical protein
MEIPSNALLTGEGRFLPEPGEAKELCPVCILLLRLAHKNSNREMVAKTVHVNVITRIAFR